MAGHRAPEAVVHPTTGARVAAAVAAGLVLLSIGWRIGHDDSPAVITAATAHTEKCD